jgi:hypothetical protein
MQFAIDRLWDGSPAAPAERARVSVSRLSEALLAVRVDAPLHGDPPPPGPPGPAPGLWEYEVVELFVGGQGSGYTEVELSPHGHSLLLRLEDVRRGARELGPARYTVAHLGGRWSGLLLLPVAWLPEGPWRGNTTAIHGQGEGRRYLSSVPLPGPRPDFHQPAAWVALDPG